MTAINGQATTRRAALVMLGAAVPVTAAKLQPDASLADDANIAAKIEEKGTKTRTAINAANVQQAERGGLFNILDYGADTAATDNSAAIQATESAARAGGGTLYIPAGAWRIASPVDVAVSIRADGEVLVAASSRGRVNVVRILTPATAEVSGDVSAGSGNMAGLAGRMGDLYLTSTEHLVERNNGTPGQHYVKSEVSKIVSTAGAVSPPIRITYNSPSTVTATVYPTEPTLNLDKLRITVDGAGSEADDYAYLTIMRSDVTIDDLAVVNESSADLTNAVVVRQATNVEFNRPTVHGFNKAGTGYGIARYNTADVRINNPRITGCRHAVSGLWNKDTTIDRGTSEGGLDDHWAWGFHVNHHNSTVGAGLTHVLVAGADVVVTGGTFTGGRNLLGIRADTPEMSGTLALQGDWEWTPAASAPTKWIMGYSTPNLPAFDHGRTLHSPARATISRGIVNLASGAGLYGIYEGGADFPHEYWGTLTVDGTRRTPGGVFTAVNADRNPTAHPGATVGTHVIVRGLGLTAAGDTVIVSDKGDTGVGPSWSVAVQDCTGFYLKLAERGIESVTVDRTEVRRVFRSGVSSAPSDIGLKFRDCTMSSVNFNGTHRADFSRCVWKGSAISTALAMDLRVKSYIGNLHHQSATGHPTQPDGYRSTSFYKAST